MIVLPTRAGFMQLDPAQVVKVQPATDIFLLSPTNESIVTMRDGTKRNIKLPASEVLARVRAGL